MHRFWKVLLGHDCPTRREMLATRDAVDGLEARVDQHYAELRALRGRVNGMRRWEADHDTEKPAQAAPGATIPRPKVYDRPEPKIARNY